MTQRKRFDEIGEHRLSYAATHLLVNAIGKTALGLKAYGTEHIPSEGGAIIATNHRHWLDVFLEPATVKDRHVSMVAKVELYDTPILGKLITDWESIPVDRENPTTETSKIVIQRLKAGRLVSVKPEGTRIKGDELGSFERGVAFWARLAKVPTIPAAISGIDNPKRAILKRSAKLNYGSAIDFPKTKDEELEYIELLRKTIQDLYDN